ncbi:molybdopterin-guanine dinucleotide biosynthesis protein B [Candidatus Bathyarchaeota archaeon A05DMB-4]|nr:molybdopterin-guanine dinucleotide biosynthesis protein B [Candidatus Bathyarchaeota archaeon A05DMB-4]
MTVIFAVVGSKESGKTTTIEYLTRQLAKEGFKVGAIKHIHDPAFSIDTPRKDTFRFAQAGAKIIVAATSREIAIIKKSTQPDESFHLPEILNLINKENLDVVFLEGFHSTTAKRKDIQKIITAKNEDDLKKTLRGTVPPILAATGVLATLTSKSQIFNLPLVNISTNGESLVELVKKTVRKTVNRKKDPKTQKTKMPLQKRK